MELPKMEQAEVQELEIYMGQSISIMDEARKVAIIRTPAECEAASQWCSVKLGWCDRIKKSYLGRVRDYFHKGWKDAILEIDKYVVPVEGKDSVKGDTGGAVGEVRRAISVWRAQEAKRVADLRAKEYEEARQRDEADRLAAAEKLEAAGNTTMADAVLSQAGNFVAPVVPEFKSKTQSGRMVWKIRFDESKKGELLKMIADRPDLHAFAIIDTSRILKQAALMDGNLNWPGVTCFQEEELRISKARF